MQPELKEQPEPKVHSICFQSRRMSNLSPEQKLSKDLTSIFATSWLEYWFMGVDQVIISMEQQIAMRRRLQEEVNDRQK